jgi:hypothetical protein
VNWLGITITDAKGKVAYENAFVTSLPVTTGAAAESVACGRARWKIKNESFNVLESNGYHVEHHLGHGAQNLAMMFAAFNLLPFAIHTVCDCLGQLWTDAEPPNGRENAFSNTSGPSSPISSSQFGKRLRRP